MMTYTRMTDLDLGGKRVLIRQDLNVPMAQGVISSDARIRASIPTIRHAIDQGAAVMIMSHLGRPVEGEFNPEFSLAPVAQALSRYLEKPVKLLDDYLEGVEVAPGEVVLLENVRFNPGEKKDHETLAKKLAALCDIYVMDAFGTAHRAEASTHGTGLFAPIACAGLLLAEELDALGKALKSPARPLVAIVGGSKVSSKLTVLDSLSAVVDQLIVGGGIANTFIRAAGYNIGKSLYEPDLVAEAKRLMQAATAAGREIPIPVDVVTGKHFDPAEPAIIKPVDALEEDDMIFDIGPETAAIYAALIAKAGTVVWNGPVGVFEFDQFGKGTETLGRAIAESQAFSIAGGGDTLAAIDKYGLAEGISYISTGGGAFLEFLEGKTLPAVSMLERRHQST